MNIKGQGHSLTFVQGHSDSIFSNFFSSKSTRPIEAIFHVEPSWYGRMEMSINGLYHVTKMAAMPIYAKRTFKIFFSGTERPMNLKLGRQHRVFEYYQVCSNDAPGLTLTYFTARSNWSPVLLYGKKLNNAFFRNYCSL